MADAPRREPDCLFCRIVAGEIPADVVRQGRRTLAFRDVSPQAPVHVLVVTQDHYPDIAAVVATDHGLAAELVDEATLVAEEEGLAIGGFRIVLNTGTDGGQTVAHVHAHVLGGRPMGWPPG
jgi:histidine triad (HIT) family protein